VPSSSRTITRILRERGYINDPPKHEHQSLPLSAPMEEWEMDFCEIRLMDGRASDEAFPPDEVQLNAWLQAQHGRVFRRRIRSNGTVQVDKHTYYVDDKLAKRAVLAHLDAAKRCLRVTVDGVALAKSLPLKDLHAERLALFDYLKILQREAMSIAHYREMVWRQSSEVA